MSSANTSEGYRKSSYSTANGECVEVWDQPDRVQVRDSKNPDGAELTFPAGQWSGFLAAIKAREFHRP
jgi:hypothetical protein